MDFYLTLFIFCPAICAALSIGNKTSAALSIGNKTIFALSISNKTAATLSISNKTANALSISNQTQVAELGNYLDGILHKCRPTFLNPMIRHLEEMDGLDMKPDTKVLLMIAASSALGCPNTAECVADEFSENFGNHSLPLDCTVMSEQDKIEEMSIEEHEAAKKQFYIILGSFLKNVKQASNKKSSRRRWLKTNMSKSSNKLVKKLILNSLFTNIVGKKDKQSVEKVYRRRMNNKGKSKITTIKPKEENNTLDERSKNHTKLIPSKNNATSSPSFTRIDRISFEDTASAVDMNNKKVNDGSDNPNLTMTYLSSINNKNDSEVANNSLQVYTRRKRDTVYDVIIQDFDENHSCKILLTPIAIWLRAPLAKCIEACEEDTDCETLAHTDLGQDGEVCRFHGLTTEEAGILFKCDPIYSGNTVYAKKDKESFYVFTNQHNGLVITATGGYWVELTVYTGDDSQFWLWNRKTGAIESKKFPGRYLNIFFKTLYLWSQSNHKLRSFDSGIGLSKGEMLTADTNGKRVVIKSKFMDMRQEWTVQDTIIPVFLTNVKNGNVLQTKGDTSTEVNQYTGENNQEWVFDGISVRSVKHPHRVLTLANDKASFNLKKFENTDMQKFALKENVLIAVFCQNSEFCLSWRISLERDYFTITSKVTAKVVDAPNANTVYMHEYHGGDNQLWFWDGECLRSKKYPGKVLHLHILSYEIYLGNYREGENQKWKIEEDSLLSFYKDLTLNIYHGSNNDEAIIGDYKQTGSVNQKWSFNLGERIYFTISSHMNAKVVDAPDSMSIQMWDYHGQDHQLWFWDDECIRSKMYPEKVLTLHMRLFVIAKIYLGNYDGGENQKWNIEDGRLVSFYKSLNLEIYGSSAQNSAKIVGNTKTSGGVNQLWSMNFGNRLYFTISTYLNGKVLDSSGTSEQHLTVKDYHGGDDQLWFLDGEYIRSKIYPEKLLHLHEIDYLKHGWGRIYLTMYNGGIYQRWTVDGGKLVSSYKNLNMEIYQSDASDGVKVGGNQNTDNMNQVWSFNFGSRSFFSISSFSNAKVLDALNSDSVFMQDYTGGDNQIWVFDGELIRSKMYPEKVLEISTTDYEKRSWGLISMKSAHGGENQKWQVDGGKLVSFYKGLKMNIYGGSKTSGAKVGGSRSNQLWSLNPGKRFFFHIKSKLNSKCLDAPGETQEDNRIHMWDCHDGDNQQWFWDGDFLRSKQFPERCIKLYVPWFLKYNWGQIYLHKCEEGEDITWKVDEDELVSFYEDLRLDIKGASKANRALVGGYKRTNKENQEWNFSAVGSGTSSCADETEEDIYSVVQWIPFVSTLWDLGSSIAYAAAGCTSIAEERAVSMAIGAVMDIGTVLTFGTGAVAFQGAKQGIKLAINVGIKEALKQGTKSVVKMGAKLISKNILKSVSKQGIKKVLKSGTKFVWKNVVVDNFNLLKSAFKLTKTLVKNPIKTVSRFGKGIKATGQKIAELKDLKKFNIKSWASDDYPYSKSINIKADDVIRCKRGLVICRTPEPEFVITPEPELKKAMEDLQKNIFQDSPITQGYKKNIIKNTEFSFHKIDETQTELFQLKTNLESSQPISEEDLQKYLVYDYTVNSGSYNHMFRGAHQDNLAQLPSSYKNIFEINIERNIALQNAVEKSHFIQKYLIKQPIAPVSGEKLQVYRKLKAYDNLDKDFTQDQIIQLDTFISTSRNENVNLNAIGSAEKFDVEMTILTRSGRDVSKISKFPEQEEVLLPMYNHYKVTKFEKKPIKDVLEPSGNQKYAYKIEMEEVYLPNLVYTKPVIPSSNWLSFCCIK